MGAFPRLCVCLDALAAELPLPDALELAGPVGALEFWDWRGRNVEALGRHARARGVDVVAFSGNTFDEPLIDADSHARTLRHLARSLEVAKGLGVRVLATHVGYAQPGHSREAQWEAAVQGLRQAGDLAAGSGVALAVEPLNSALDHPGYFLDTLPDALRMLDDVDHASVRLLLDIYHMRMMHDDLLDRLPEALALTVHVHVADVPGRREPGSGAIRWDEIMRILRASGYAGAVGLECWPTTSPEAALRQAVEVLS